METGGGRGGSVMLASSPDGFLPLLGIRGDVKLHLFSRPLDLHLNDLWRTKMAVSFLFSRVFRSRAWNHNVIVIAAAAMWQ